MPEVLLAANAMKAGMAILRPLLAETGAPPIGKMVIGTVKGDIHDIGKNLVGMMMEGAGFEVIDLGINCDVDKYLNALEQHKPDILGMSALLTTTMPYMKVVIDTLKEKGMRDDYVVLVGGAPLNEAFAQAVGADAYCRDAAVAVETAKTYGRTAPQPARRPRRGEPMAAPRTLLIACGALAREALAVLEANRLEHVELTCLPAMLHNRPQKIPAAVRAKIRGTRGRATTRSWSSTATAAPAASWTACWPRRAWSGSRGRTATPSTPGWTRSTRWPRPSPAPSTSPTSSPGSSRRW